MVVLPLFVLALLLLLVCSVRDFVDVANHEVDLMDRTLFPRMPWHDVHMRVDGQPAVDVARYDAHGSFPLTNSHRDCPNGWVSTYRWLRLRVPGPCQTLY